MEKDSLIKVSGLAVDIDETLSKTNHHWVEQLQKAFGNPEGLSVEELVKKYRYTQNVPYWQSKEALDWMEYHRNSNKTHEILPLIEGSPVFLEKISKIVPIAAYLTTRPDTVREGTRKWLEKHKFPKAPLMCRPKEIPTHDGNMWKANVLKEEFPKIKGIIDDNPGLVKFLEPDYKGIFFLYDHVQVKSKINIVACKEWEAVFVQVKKNYSK